MKVKSAPAILISIAGFLALGLNSDAQTIPEIMATSDHSLGRAVEVETGGIPSIESILRDTDLIVRGIVGPSTSYLSEDQTKVYSDYRLLKPVILFPAERGATPQPMPAPPIPSITVTQLGGTISLFGHEFTMEHRELPLPKVGTEGIFLLKRASDKYTIAGTLYGAFQIKGDSLIPLSRLEGFGPELRDIPIAQAIQQLVATKRALR